MVPLSDVLTFFAMAIAAGNITTNSMGTAYEVRYIVIGRTGEGKNMKM